MKKRNVKRIFTYIVSLMLLLILTSCAKVVRVEDTPIQVKVIDANYSSSYTRVTPIIVNNNVIMCNHIIPESYKIAIEYEGQTYHYTDENAYHKYSDKVGEYVDATLLTKFYDNGKNYKDVRLDY